MSTTIKGSLSGTDYSDKYELSRQARTYEYKLTASDGGKVSFKVEKYSPPLLGESGGGQWYTIEDKSRVASGTSFEGRFVVPETVLSSSSTSEWSTIRITFSRKALSHAVGYEFYFEPA